MTGSRGGAAVAGDCSTEARRAVAAASPQVGSLRHYALPMATGSGSLRDRKKAATRRALIDAAERLFEERGFDAVTVAEIADAANVSVKTMFVYFRSKEDLVFADNALIESLVAAVRNRPAGSAPADEIVRVVTSAIDPAHVPEGLEGFHRGYGQSP
jgi:aspartate/methionine/tyrosine aminotransferase